MIRVESIQFRHDLDVRHGYVLMIRRDAAQPVPVPEWRRAVSQAPEDSPAAYALDGVRRRSPRILARFRSLEPGLRSAEVRAMQAVPPPDPFRPAFLPHPQLIWPGNYWFSGWWEYSIFLLYSAYYRRWQEGFQEVRPNVLGTVVAKRVRFGGDGLTAPEPMELANLQLEERGVDASDVSWRWQYRRGPGEPWRDADVTRHRIYSVLSTPTAPWVQNPAGAANVQLPWTDALEVACRWAAGARSEADAARAITESVFRLGDDRVLEYGCPILAMTMYTSPLGLVDVFDCTAFLERLGNGIGNGPFVNCTDCASITSSFANILGCDLWQSRMGMYTPAFDTNPIQAIGTAPLQSPCGLGLGFMFHEVAWTGECDVSDKVFDACLKVRVDPPPGSLVPGRLLPVDMQFGENGEGQYRDHIAAPAARDICIPRPQERKRRAVI